MAAQFCATDAALRRSGQCFGLKPEGKTLGGETVQGPGAEIGPQNLALAEGVGELLGHCGRGCSGGEGDNQSDGEEDLLQWCVSDLVAASG
jgi:hypothetical protein